VAHVSVQIQWPDGLENLPPGSRARVTVEDATEADASSTVLAETVLEDLDPATAPVAEIDVPDVSPHAVVIARVQVTPGRRDLGGVEVGDLISTQSHPVLTRGHGDSVVVPLTKVGG
jgi:hypothetical protein